MEYRLLGSSGCAVSAVALGTLTPEETLLLDEASEPPTPDYPYGEP